MSKHVASELERLLSIQPTLDPSTDRYTILCRNLELLACQADMYDLIEQYIEQARAPEGMVTNVVVHPALAEKLENYANEHPMDGPPFPETEEEPSSKVVEFPAVAQAAEESKPEIDLITVRRAMKEAKKRGVDIAAAVQELGGRNLTDLSPDQWPALMKKLEENA